MAGNNTPKGWRIAGILLFTLIGGAVGLIVGFPLADLFMADRPPESIMVLPVGKIGELLDFVIGSTLVGGLVGLFIGFRRVKR